GMLDTLGNYILSLDYDLIRNYDEFTLIQKNKKLALFTENQGIITEFIYDDFLDIFHPDYILLKSNQGDFLLNQKGETVYTVDKGEQIIDMKDSLLIVKDKKTDKMFLRNLSNNNLFVSDYNEMQFVNNVLKVAKGRKTGIVTYNNEIIIPLDFSTIYPFKDNYFIVSKDKLTGLYQQSNIMLPLKYKHIVPLLNDYLYVENEKNLNGMYDVNLNVVIPEEYKIYEYYKSYY